MPKKRPPRSYIGIKNIRQQTGRERRMMLVSQLYLEGCTVEHMAAHFKQSPATIRDDLKKIRERWQKESIMAMDERKAKELARLDKIEAECWSAWNRSIETQKITTRKVRYVRIPVKGRKGVHKKVPAEEVKDQTIRSCSGDPRFLEQIERCVTMRLKLFGLLKGDTNNMNQVFIDWSGLVGGEGVAVNPIEEKIKMMEQQSHITNTDINNNTLALPNRKQVIEVEAKTKK